MPAARKKRPESTLPEARLPIPDAIAIKDTAGRLVGWDARAAHAVVAANAGQPCPPACDHIEPADFTPFTRLVAPSQPAPAVDEAAVQAHLRRHPHPIVTFGGEWWEPRDGFTVLDVVRAAVAEGLAQERYDDGPGT